MQKNTWKTLSSKIVYENDFNRKIREHQVIRPDGSKGTYAVYEVPPGVYIIPLTKEKEVYLVGQFRFPVQEYSWEFPAGGIDEKDGHDIEDAAKRELKEETGLTAKKWVNLGYFYQSNGSTNEKGIVFLAEDLTQTGENKQKEEGINKMKKFKLDEVLDMIRKGDITDATVMACLLKAAGYLGIGIK